MAFRNIVVRTLAEKIGQHMDGRMVPSSEADD